MRCPTFAVAQSPRTAYSYVIQCWKAYSEFAVYGTNDQYCVPVGTLEPDRNERFLINTRISHVKISNHEIHPCLILSWFDRFDRMIFCNYLKSLSQFKDCSSGVSLVIFVHQYL
jgi:hypothetical protein